jgi:hypothetical protein
MKPSQFTPDPALLALPIDELIALYASTSLPKWQIEYTLALRAHELSAAAVRGLKHAHPQVRRLCGQLLDHYGDDRSSEPLAALLSDPIDHVRWQVVHALLCGRCKPQSIELSATLMQRLVMMTLHDPSTRVRTEALGVLALHPSAATPAVRAELRTMDTELAARATPSKRQRALQRSLRSVLSLTGA